MGEKKEKKEMSKGMRIFVIILLSALLLYLLIPFFTNIGNLEQTVSGRSTEYYTFLGIWLIIVFLCGYGIIKNILKLIGKDKKFTAEQLQKRKKRNTILGLSSVTAFVLIIVVMFGYGNISENMKKEQMISKIKEYEDNGYFGKSSSQFYQNLETASLSDVEKELTRRENIVKSREEYNQKFSSKLDEIFAKEIKVELYKSEDNNYVYVPFNTNTGATNAKAQVEYVTIYGNNIYDIYYSVEMDLTVYNKYNGKVVSRGTDKKYYKVNNINELNKTIEISGYKGLGDELSNDIEGKTNKVVARPSENKNYKYDFINIEK